MQDSLFFDIIYLSNYDDQLPVMIAMSSNHTCAASWIGETGPYLNGPFFNGYVSAPIPSTPRRSALSLSRFTVTVNPPLLTVQQIKEGFKMKKYEELEIGIIKLSYEEIITTSPFDGEVNAISGW